MKSIWPQGEKITAIVPAFNEEQYIESVVSQLKACHEMGIVHEVIVISDGSTDNTVRIARRQGTAVIELKTNRGKSRAFAAGARFCRRNGSTIVLMLDADLKTITPRQLTDLIRPLVRSPNKDMSVGTVRNDLTGISGQRAIRVKALEPLFRNSRTWRRKLFITGYGLEVALHDLLKRQVIAKTDFRTARPAEGKKLGVKGSVDATSKYIATREGLAVLLRELRSDLASLPPERISAIRRKLLRQARDKERQRYLYYAGIQGQGLSGIQ
jgi:glycosyltransferase involved in cell wall biosynthesis